MYAGVNDINNLQLFNTIFLTYTKLVHMTAVQSNRRVARRGRGGSWLARTRLADHTASALDNSGKSPYTHALAYTHTHYLLILGY